jgi:iron complex outermembrane receptor protein
VLLLLCGGLGATAVADEVAARLGDLTIEQLLNVEITSVSKKEEPLLQATSAIYVISGEDIRRSGATYIPEALRMAPGLQIARTSSCRSNSTTRRTDTPTASRPRSAGRRRHGGA